MADQTSFTKTVGESYVLVADLTLNHYNRNHLQAICLGSFKVDLAYSASAESPIVSMPQGLNELTFMGLNPRGKIYAKVELGTSELTLNLW